MIEPTPSQTVGPFFALGLKPHAGDGGLRLEGRVLDGAGDGVSDALVELWHVDVGWARSATDAEGRYAFRIEKPGAIDGQAPHVTMLVFARGLLKPVLTRMYFPDEEDANAQDRVLQGVPEERRATLVAQAANGALRFDVQLQGDDETVFFAV
jgi:protocatechuate 3,4-dioxygenase alpha subunit